MLEAIDGLIARLDDLARNKRHRLRSHQRNTDEKPGWLLSKLIPDETPFDPDDSRSFRESLPEPAVWLDRLLREPMPIFARGLRTRRHHPR